MSVLNAKYNSVFAFILIAAVSSCFSGVFLVMCVLCLGRLLGFIFFFYASSVNILDICE